MKKILVTCDTEIGELGKYLDDPFQMGIMGKINGKEAGIKLINKISSEFGVVVEHFLDIYSAETYGEELFEKLCNEIGEKHNIQLHTHPSSRFDNKRILINKYNYEEQLEIIEYGIEKLKKWYGKKPIAHRAGGYGIDKNCLKALKNNGIEIDCSYFHNNRSCLIDREVINSFTMEEEVMEIPITLYEQKRNFFFGFSRKKLVKLDLKYGSSIEEIIEVIKKAPENSVLTIFLHSFQFLNLIFNFKSGKFEDVDIDLIGISDYKRLIRKISEMDNVKFTTLDKLKLEDNSEDFLIKVEKKGYFLEEMNEKFNRKFKEKYKV